MTTDCRCAACLALLAECGLEHFDLYQKKLLIRGWAGSVTSVEKAYQKAHSEWARAPGRVFASNPSHSGETGLEMAFSQRGPGSESAGWGTKSG